MRKVVELTEELREELSEIKMKEQITGKGHTNTINFLVRYYKETQGIMSLIDAKLRELDERFQEYQREMKHLIEDEIRDAIKKLFINIAQI